jgi:hypothetical protein
MWQQHKTLGPIQCCVLTTGAFEDDRELPGIDAAVASGLMPKGTVPSEQGRKEGGGVVQALQTAAAAIAFYWQEGR